MIRQAMISVKDSSGISTKYSSTIFRFDKAALELLSTAPFSDSKILSPGSVRCHNFLLLLLFQSKMGIVFTALKPKIDFFSNYFLEA
jgi:hypothetical protein